MQARMSFQYCVEPENKVTEIMQDEDKDIFISNITSTTNENMLK